MALNERDKTLSQSQQDAINKATNDYNAAKAKGDKAGMQAAHDAAEKVRNEAGYTGGGDGSKVSIIGGGGSKGNTAQNIASGLNNVMNQLGDKIKNNTSSNNGSAGGGADVQKPKAGNIARDDNSSKVSGKVYEVQKGGAPKGLGVGDQVVTNGGTYLITGVNADGSYQSSMYNANQTLKNYTGKYNAVPGSSNTGTGGVYTIGTEEGIKQALSMKPGDTFTTENGAVWTKNQDGTITVKHNGHILNGVVGSGGPVIATDNNNNKINILKDVDGNIAAITNSDGSISSSRGLVSVDENGVPKQYVITEDISTGALKMIATSNSQVTLVDREEGGALPENKLTGMNGTTLSGSDLIYGEDGRTYDKRTGKWIRDIAQEYGMDYSNVAVKVGDQYYSLDGQNITEELGAGAVRVWSGDKITDTLINALMDQGFNQMPRFSDYDKLSWEQALAQAQEQLNSSYQKSLNEALDNINQQALETGFYGQLPVEALKQQATSATELDKQTAIYDLARDLLSDSQDFAQQQYDNDMNTSEARLSTIQMIVNILQQYKAAELEKITTQKELDNEMNALILDAINTYATLTSQGMNNAQIIQYVSDIINKSKN